MDPWMLLYKAPCLAVMSTVPAMNELTQTYTQAHTTLATLIHAIIVAYIH